MVVGTKMSRWRLAFVFVVLPLTLASCAQQPYSGTTPDVPGFLLGMLHGVTAYFALAQQIFAFFYRLVTGNAIELFRIYAFPNSGTGYDFGFMIGIGFWFAAARGGKE